MIESFEGALNNPPLDLFLHKVNSIVDAITKENPRLEPYKDYIRYMLKKDRHIK